MEQTKKQKIKLGIFVIISTLFLIIALYFVGQKQNLFGSTFRITAVFRDVDGLMLGNNVRFSGINVGTVKKIEMKNDSTIYVDMIIEDEILIHLKKNILAAISSDGLVGSIIINITPMKGNAPPLVPGDTIQTFNKVSSADMMATLNKTNENAALLTIDLLKITKGITSGKGTFDLLISDENMANDLKATMYNLKLTSENANKTISSLNQMVAKVNYDESAAAVLLSDPKSAAKLKSLIENLETSGKGINTVVKNMNDVVLEMKNGKGTINYLATDTALVNNIDVTVKNLQEGSVKLNENLEALKHSLLFKRYFKKLEKEKAKEK